MGIDNPAPESNDKNAHHGAESSKQLMDDVMTKLMMNATKSPESELKDLGQIDKMDLPAEWMEGPDYSKRQHAATYKEYHPNGDSDCQLGFYYRGRRTTDAAGQHFHDLLSKAPHTLSENEQRSISEIIRDKAAPADFQSNSVRTEDLNGKRVLVVEGRYNAIQADSKHLFIDSDGSGTAVQEIFFQAPKDKYPSYIKAADDAIKSIRWK